MKRLVLTFLSTTAVCAVLSAAPAAAQDTVTGAPAGEAPVTVEGYGNSSGYTGRVCVQYRFGLRDPAGRTVPRYSRLLWLPGKVHERLWSLTYSPAVQRPPPRAEGSSGALLGSRMNSSHSLYLQEFRQRLGLALIARGWSLESLAISNFAVDHRR